MVIRVSHLRCETCQKIAFPQQRHANQYIHDSLTKVRAKGLVAGHETPVGVVPIRSYQCPHGNGWHVTSTPRQTDRLVLPGQTRTRVIAEIRRAITEQGPGLLFPLKGKVAELYDLGSSDVRRLVKQLTTEGWLVFDEGFSRYYTALGVEAPTELPLPPPVGGLADPVALAQVLLDAILQHPPGMWLPSRQTMSTHFGRDHMTIRKVTHALHDLGWVSLDETRCAYMTAVPKTMTKLAPQSKGQNDACPPTD